jgi:dTDP-4-dehydrorhamnose 3,5-epimerase
LLLIEPQRFTDQRGVFSETFKSSALADAGFQNSFIQDNLVRTASAGVIRGLHFQRKPFEQDKLIRCSAGAIFDVAVDIRPGSATYGQAESVILTSDNWLQLLVPAGFAHGYCTLSEDCEVSYKVTAAYAPETEGGLLWRDDALKIDWPISVDKALLNERDARWPTLAEWSRDNQL